MHSSMEFAALALRLSSGKLATLKVSANGMYRPAITDLRVTKAQRSPTQVNFDIDVKDLDSDLAVAGSTSVSSAVALSFIGASFDTGSATIDGTTILNTTSGTLSGTFVPANITSVGIGANAIFLIHITDSAGNKSNDVAVRVKF